jgi:hypothetical protein
MGYLNLVGSFIYKEPLFRTKLQALSDNDAQLKTDGWAVSTKTIFYQAAVPSGWTQDVSQNDKALRVVGSIGGGGSGGAQALSTTIPLAHTHAISSDDSHTHAYAAHTHTTHDLNDVTAGGLDTPSGNPTYVYYDNGGYFYRLTTAGSSTFNLLKSPMTTPGAITLGTRSAHNHGGVTDSQLSDVSLAYCDVIVGTKNAVAGSYTDLTSQWHTGDKIDFDPFASYAANDAYNYGALMPSGSISLFVQDSAPVGWTKISSTNDRMLRIVSGSGAGTGGVQLTSSGIPLAHTHAMTADTDHTHTIPNHVHQINSTLSISTSFANTGDSGALNASYVQDIGGALVRSDNSGPTASRTAYKTQSTNSGAGNTSAAGGHTHVIDSILTDVLFAYVDVIQCSKDSVGAPYAYTDYTAEFAWKKLVSYQRLNTMAKNDSYIQYHTTPITTGMLFFMASPPTGWVKQTSQHDKALRIVSGGTGGSPGGGAQLLSGAVTLAHTHTIELAGGHNHAVDHTHPLDSASVTANAAVSHNVRQRNSQLGSDIGGGNLQFFWRRLMNQSNNPTEIPVADPDHSHGGVTDSKLTNVSLAYADVIWCTKS